MASSCRRDRSARENGRQANGQQKVSRDPRFELKVRDVVGLYVDLPDHAVMLSVDEKTQIQALGRTQKPLPMTPGHAETRTHDYRRNGTTCLLAALDVATGQVVGQTVERHRSAEFLAFLDKDARPFRGSRRPEDLVEAWKRGHQKLREMASNE